MKPDLSRAFCATKAQEGHSFVTRNGKEVMQLTSFTVAHTTMFAGVVEGSLYLFYSNGESKISKTLDLFPLLQEPVLDKSKLPEGWGCEYKGKGWDNGGKDCLFSSSESGIPFVLDCELKVSCTPAGKSNAHYWLLTPPTTREDGTPLSIPPLPEIEGWRFEYRGEAWTSKKCKYALFEVGTREWEFDFSHTSSASGFPNLHYAEAFPIAKPTTLADLFPDGESQCWVHCPDETGNIEKAVQSVRTVMGVTMLNLRGITYSLSELDTAHCRYSNHPLTKFEDAKPFIA